MKSRMPAAVVGAAISLLAGCLEEELSVDLKVDGTGTAVLSGRMTGKATGLVALMDEPGGGVMDLHLGPDDFTFRQPEEAAGEALAAKGLRVTECVSRRDAEEVSARLAVAFDRVESLGLVEELRSRGGASGRKSAVGSPRFELAPAPEGTWTLSVTTPSIEVSGGSSAGAVPGEKLDAEKMRRKLHAVAELASEGLKAKGRIALAVPGEILEAGPEKGMTRGEATCSWSFDFNGLANLAIDQGWEPGDGELVLPPVTFRVRFRLPEGTSFPAAVPAAEGPGDAVPTPRQRFTAELEKVYDYLPSEVSPAVRKAKYDEMEAFWKFVGSDLPTYLPLLREALRDESRNRYFFYDGAGLLREHAQGREDLQLAADATARCRLEDVGDRGYFYFCTLLCREDIDAYAPVVKMLEKPGFSVSVPRHSLVLRQGDAVLLCLLANGERHWVERFLRRLPDEKDPTAAGTILRCLSMAVTAEADAAVRAVAGDGEADPKVAAVARLLVFNSRIPPLPAGPPTRTRAEFEGYLERAEADGRLPSDEMASILRTEALHHVRPGDAPRLRALRRLSARRVSDEALLDIAFLTGLLRRADSMEK